MLLYNHHHADVSSQANDIGVSVHLHVSLNVRITIRLSLSLILQAHKLISLLKDANVV